MHSSPAGFRRALVALDGSTPAERVVLWLRRLLAPGAEVHLLTVLPPAQAVVTEAGTIYADQMESSASLAALVALGVVAGRLGADRVCSTSHVRFGDPARLILATAREADAEVIAMTAGEGRPWWRRPRGNVTERVMGQSRVPVLVARARGQRGA